jgi:mRNA-degrading endonuclease RelE of RelBE toxin-antitoxin system
MRSFTSRRFRESYARLPKQVRLQTHRAYQLFKQNPSHPGLNFKKMDGQNNIYSVRIGLGYRALGQVDGSDIVWFWIGAHADYDKLV